MKENQMNLVAGPNITREDEQIVNGRGKIIREVTTFEVEWTTRVPGYLEENHRRSFPTPGDAGEFAQELWDGAGVYQLKDSEEILVREAKRDYINLVRGMNPDEILIKRLDELERELDA